MIAFISDGLRSVGRMLWLCSFLYIAVLAPAQVFPVQRTSAAPPTASVGDAEPESQVPASVEVEPVAGDGAIAERLQSILEATDWFTDPKVKVEEGVVFLDGKTQTDVRKKWAGDVAGKTRDVVAVVNQIEVVPGPIWDFGAAVAGLRAPFRALIAMLPTLLFALAVLVAAYFTAIGITHLLLSRFNRRESMTPLLRQVASRAAGFVVFLLGLYLVLLTVGLARLAVTVLGGTGLIGLIIGIAFRDITENFLASIFLSLQRPFRAGDLIQVADITGIVQRLTVRTTVLMTLDGNHVQIPNSIIYKSTLRNYTSNRNRREDFIIGIGYDEVVAEAQQVAMDVLRNHPAVLSEPEPWVLVDNLGTSTVNLKVYFWLDGSQYSWLKVRSSVIRLVKRAFQEHGISMPDEAREVIIRDEVPLNIRFEEAAPGREAEGPLRSKLEPRTMPESVTQMPRKPVSKMPEGESSAASIGAEGGLYSEEDTLKEQARGSRMPEQGQDLLN